MLDRSLFERALDLPRDARAAFLDTACPDPESRARVEALLEAHDRAGDSFLERSASELTFGSVGRIGRRLGAYRILREIGRGGMGAVYLATRADDEFAKQVAIKIVAAPLGEDDLIRRFRRERQILAQLEHPNIARLFDGGTTDEGLPFLVMEFVDGIGIVEYCQSKGLDVRERLLLFLDVCAAVQHAHANLVIHRDLKPRNILITADGTPRLLDFGIAVLLSNSDAVAGATQTASHAMTPEYASPEQVRGERVGTATDVYSLGLLLYEMLTATRPYDVSGKRADEVYRLVCETEPARPSTAVHDRTLSRRLSGDLDGIVMMALRKDPTRRYISVALLADDVRRHLDGRAVNARGEALSYRAVTFVRRHRLAVAGAVLLLLMLISGIVVTRRQAVEAERLRAAAVQERDRAIVAEQAALNERDRAVRAEQQAAAQQRLAEEARNQALDASRRADVEAATATAVRQFLGDDLLAQASSTTQADTRASPDPDLKVRDALDRAAARIGTRFTSQPLVEAAIRQTIGMTYLQMGLHKEAAPHLEQALALRTRTLGPRHVDTLVSMGDLGYIYMRLGQMDRARPLFKESYEGLRAVLGENDQRTMTVLGNSAAAAPRPDRDALWARLLPVQQRLLGDEHPETLALMNNLGVSYTDAGRYAEAESLYERVVSVKKRILGDDHPSTLISIHALGVNYRFLGKYPEAEKTLASVYEIRRRTLGEEHPETLVTMNALALVYGARGRYLESESLLQRALDARRRVLGEVHLITIGTLNSLAELYRKQGRLAEAAPLFERVLEVRRREVGPEDRNTANALTSLGELTLARENYAAAERLLRDALNAQTKSSNRGTWRFHYTQSLLGAALVQCGRASEAGELLTEGYQGLVNQRASIPFETGQIVDEAKASLETLKKSDRSQPPDSSRHCS